MNPSRHAHLVDVLAAEYVLGTLRGGARRRFERYANHDAAIRQAVDEWQRRMAPMAEFATPRMPPAAVWDAIERRLDLAAMREPTRSRTSVRKPTRPARSIFENLAFWRGWALGVTGLAAVAVVVAVRSLLPPATPLVTSPVTSPVTPPVTPPITPPVTLPVMPPAAPSTIAQQSGAAVSHVAVLNNKSAHPVMLVAWDETHSTMTVHPLGKVDLPAHRAMELWGIPASGHPVSLGMLPDSAEGKLAAGQQKPETYAALAVSIEAPGGSPNHNAPSGPVVLTGKLLPVS